jgi:hypothetical protein
MPLSALPPPPVPNKMGEPLLGLKTPEYEPFEGLPVGSELLSFEVGRLGASWVTGACSGASCLPLLNDGGVTLESAVVIGLETLGVSIVLVWTSGVSTLLTNGV